MGNDALESHRPGAEDSASAVIFHVFADCGGGLHTERRDSKHDLVPPDASFLKPTLDPQSSGTMRCTPCGEHIDSCDDVCILVNVMGAARLTAVGP